MQQAEAIRYLAKHRNELREQFEVAALAIFGSTECSEATETSDIDFLVEFNRPTGLFALVRLQLHLEEFLGTAVDVGTIDGLEPRIRERVLAKSIYVN